MHMFTTGVLNKTDKLINGEGVMSECIFRLHHGGRYCSRGQHLSNVMILGEAVLPVGTVRINWLSMFGGCSVVLVCVCGG